MFRSGLGALCPSGGCRPLRIVGCIRGLGGARSEVPSASAHSGEVPGEQAKGDPACHTSDRMEATPPFQ